MIVGTLGPGRHNLDTNNIPFLSKLLEKVTGGDLFITEIYFVTSQPEPGFELESWSATGDVKVLREAFEEIGLPSAVVEIAGYLPEYRTATGFRATPVVAMVTPPFELRLDAFEVAEALRKATRATDVVARWGGEEFVLVFSGADAQSSSIMAEHVRQAMEQIELPVGKITVSIGGITLIPEGQYSLEQAMETADQLLYEAKQSGRNRVCWQSRLN